MPRVTAFEALREVLENPAAALIADTKAAAEVRALDDFFETLADRPDRALYGPARPRRARHARDRSLLIVESSSQGRNEAQMGETVDEVRGAGGKTHVFSAAHASGEQLWS